MVEEKARELHLSSTCDLCITLAWKSNFTPPVVPPMNAKGGGEPPPTDPPDEYPGAQKLTQEQLQRQQPLPPRTRSERSSSSGDSRLRHLLILIQETNDILKAASDAQKAQSVHAHKTSQRGAFLDDSSFSSSSTSAIFDQEVGALTNAAEPRQPTLSQSREDTASINLIEFDTVTGMEVQRASLRGRLLR